MKILVVYKPQILSLYYESLNLTAKEQLNKCTWNCIANFQMESMIYSKIAANGKVTYA